MNAVTGAFGYTGKYIARRLLEIGEPVITLTGHPDRPNQFDAAVKALPFRFDNPEAMAESLAGVRVLYNTYWVRFGRGDVTHERAVANSRALIRAAVLAGVERLVHVSIANAGRAPHLPYYRGKALVEEEVRRAGIGYAIVRPTVIFSLEDILINNIAFLLRKAPVFVIPGSGSYRLQPVYVEDMARITVDAGHSGEDVTMDAVGPEIFSFEELVTTIARTVGSRAVLLHGPPWLALTAARVMGAVLGDVVLTREELEGLMANLLVSDGPRTGSTHFSHWLAENGTKIGKRYASELKRHYA